MMGRGVVTLALRDGARLSFDQDTVTLQDGRGNGLTIRTAAGGVAIHASGALELRAERITLEASGTVDIRAGATLCARGALVEIN